MCKLAGAMLQKKAIYKVPNGKLLKIFLAEDDGLIVFVKITGDFFTYPEENIEKLETFLKGANISAESLTKKINDFVEKNPTVFFGLDIESLVQTILQATHERSECASSSRPRRA